MSLHYCFKVLRIVENEYHQISRKNAAEMYALWIVAKYSAKLFSMAFDVGISRAPSLAAPNHPHTPPSKNDRFEIVSTLYTYMQETHVLSSAIWMKYYSPNKRIVWKCVHIIIIIIIIISTRIHVQVNSTAAHCSYYNTAETRV